MYKAPENVPTKNKANVDICIVFCRRSRRTLHNNASNPWRTFKMPLTCSSAKLFLPRSPARQILQEKKTAFTKKKMRILTKN